MTRQETLRIAREAGLADFNRTVHSLEGLQRFAGLVAAAELRQQYDRITTLEAALRQALEALERGETELRYQAITAVQQALGSRHD